MVRIQVATTNQPQLSRGVACLEFEPNSDSEPTKTSLLNPAEGQLLVPHLVEKQSQTLQARQQSVSSVQEREYAVCTI